MNPNDYVCVKCKTKPRHVQFLDPVYTGTKLERWDRDRYRELAEREDKKLSEWMRDALASYAEIAEQFQEYKVKAEQAEK